MLAKPKTATRQVDSKGRIVLDRRFVNRMVMVEEVDDTEVRITMARVIPEREAWLYDNLKAKNKDMGIAYNAPADRRSWKLMLQWLDEAFAKPDK